MSFDPSKPPLVSETLLKSRRSLEDLSFKRSLIVPALRKRKRTVRGEDIKIKRPEQFIRKYRTQEGSLNKVFYSMDIHRVILRAIPRNGVE